MSMTMVRTLVILRIHDVSVITIVKSNLTHLFSNNWTFTNKKTHFKWVNSYKTNLYFMKQGTLLFFIVACDYW